MTNERAYLTQVLTATPRDFAQAIKSADGDAERVLRVHFGDSLFERMQQLAQNVTATPEGNVVMLPGILGSSLYENEEHIWLSPFNIILGQFDQLPLDGTGTSLKPIQAPNLLKKYYGEMQLTLLNHWNVVSFPYDWRLEIRASAQGLKKQIDTILGPSAKFSFAVHSMGGLVARSYLQQFPGDWARVQRFIMMGTPNYGSFAIPVLYNGLNNVMKVVALLDQEHYMADLLQFAKTFVGTYEMQPFVGKSPDATKLLDPAVYGNLNPPQLRFDNAKSFQQEIATAIKPDVMTYIAGYGFKTADAIADWSKLQSWVGYHQTLNGDGTVPHALGFIDTVTNYFVEVEHSSLPADSRVIQAVVDIVSTGSTTALPTKMPPIEVLNQTLLQTERITEAALRDARVHLLREVVRLERVAHPDKVSQSESELDDFLYTNSI
jgi:pimeloyl-ACP methyl ester carboxylesterase